MTANHEIIIKFKIVQECENASNIINPHKVVEIAAQELADILTEFNAVTSYEILHGKVDAK